MSDQAMSRTGSGMSIQVLIDDGKFALLLATRINRMSGMVEFVLMGS